MACARSSLVFVLWSRLLVAVAVPGLIVGTAAPASAQQKKLSAKETEALEEKAQEAFGNANHQVAIDSLSTLLERGGDSAKTPLYLFNRGRAHLGQRDAEKALVDLTEARRRFGNKLPADRRAKLDGYIQEAEAMRAAPAPVPAAPVPPPAAPASAVPQPQVIAPNYAPAQQPPVYSGPPQVSAQPAFVPAPTSAGAEPIRSPAEAPRMGTGRIVGLVLVAAGAVAAGVGGLVNLKSQSDFDEARKQGCPNGNPDVCQSAFNSVTDKNSLARILYIAGGVMGASGVVVFLANPAASPESTARASGSAPGARLAYVGRF